VAKEIGVGFGFGGGLIRIVERVAQRDDVQFFCWYEAKR
jgi:hypothetical protein